MYCAPVEADGHSAPDRREVASRDTWEEWSDARLAELRRLFDLDQSHRLIAETMGLSKGSVSGKISRLGWTRPARPKPEAKVKPERVKPKAKANVVELVPSTALGLLDLGRHSCRWPVGLRDGEHVFCGQLQALGRPYCPAHARRAWPKADIIEAASQRTPDAAEPGRD